jgi:hypothetical protein
MGQSDPSERISDLTTYWEFGPHTILLRKERKEGVVGREKVTKRRREERLSSRIRGRTKKKKCSCHRMWLARL